MMRIVFVCTGNTCRSPMAETLFRDAAQKAGLDMPVCSAGIHAMAGEGPSQGAVTAMVARGLDASAHRACLFTPDMAEEALVLTMTRQQEQAVKAAAPYAHVHTLAKFIGEAGDIPDPYGGDQAVYDACAEELTRMISTLVTRLCDKG